MRNQPYANELDVELSVPRPSRFSSQRKPSFLNALKRGGKRRRKTETHSPAVENLEPRALLSAVSSQFGTDVEQATPVRNEVAIVDPNVDGFEQLVASLESGNNANTNITVFVLNPDENGVTQIGEFLSDHQNLDAVHVFSHGDDANLQLGSVQLNENSFDQYAAEIAQWGQALGEDADLLLYGCNLAASESGLGLIDSISTLTGADVAASDDLTGHESLGGDWDLEISSGQIETAVAIDVATRASFIGHLALADATLSIVSDGTPVWDANNDPGNDTGGDNGIIRSHDTLVMEVFYNTDSNGATDLHFTSTLPVGLVYDNLPAAAALDSRSNISPDGRTITAYLPDVAGTFTSSVTFEARALGGAQGTPLNGVEFEVNSNENATPIQTDAFDFVLSSAAHMDIQLLSPTFRGVHTDAAGAVDGVVYSYGIGILGAHPTRTGTDGVKGSAPIEDDFTFDIDLTDVTPNAEVFSWGQSLGTASDNALDGLTRNYERFVNPSGSAETTWSQSNRPSGQFDEVPGSLVWSVERSTPDSGDWNITGSAGTVFSAQVSGADTTGSHFPDNHGGGGVIPAADRWFTSSQVHVWIPIDDILPGEDGIVGTADDNLLAVTPRLTNFDPDDAFGITNNFGAGTEDPSNNEVTHTIRSFSIGGPTKYNSQAAHPTSGRWLDTATQWNSGDAETSLGHIYDARVTSGRNQGVLSLPGAIFGDKFDNTATRIVANSLPSASGDGWSRVYSSGGPFSGTHLAYGVDYIIEFGTGGVDADPAGWTDWDSMGDATLADDQSIGGFWSEDPTDVNLGGNAYPDGVRDSITKFRIIMLRDLEPGETLIGLVSMETIGHSTLDPGINPGGNIIANFSSASIGYLRDNANPADDWFGSEYDPLTNSFYAGGNSNHVARGDRLWIVDANIDVDKSVVDLGAGNNYLAGSAATIQLEGTVTIPGPDDGSPAEDVYITDLLPAGLTVVGGTASPAPGSSYVAGDGSTQTVQAVEYWDGAAWSDTWTYGASGIRWFYGDVPLNTALPTMTFDVLIPFDAENGESWTNTAVGSSPSDDSTEDFRSSSAGLVAVQVAAMAAGKFVVTPLVPEDTTIVYELGIANVSDDKDVPWFDLIDILPHDADFEGSAFSGVYTDINIVGLDPGLEVYVTSTAPTALDAADGTVDGYGDPGTSAAGDSWFVPEGTGIWTYTLADVQAGVAGAPTPGQVTAIRVVSDKGINPYLEPGESTTFLLELTPDGNVGIPSDHYTNKFTARTDPANLPLPVTSAAVTAVVVAPDIEIEKEVALDETQTDIDPLDDAHWGETVSFDDTDKAFFRLQVTNTGTTDLLGVAVTDNLPAGATLVAGSAVATTGDVSAFPSTWTLDLAAGDTAYLIYQIDVNDSGNYPNTADVLATDQFGQSVNDTDDAEANFVTEISVAKQQTGVSRSATNPDHFEVTYEVELLNSSLYDLANLTLGEDLFTQFGAGYQGVFTDPLITGTSLSSGATAPTINGGFDGNLAGGGDDQILAGDGLLTPGDSVTIEYKVLVDPSLLADPVNTVNQVVGGGETGGPGGTSVSDLSDDGSDPATDNPDARGDDGAGGTNDPTPLFLPIIDLEKQVVGSPTPAASGVNGNFDVTYEFTLTNEGTVDLTNIDLTEDFVANLGGAFVGIVDGPRVTATDATDNPDLNFAYDGGTADAHVFATAPTTETYEFNGNTSESYTGTQTVLSDQSFVIDPNQVYTLSADAFADDGAGGAPDAGSLHFLGFASYDIDGLLIGPQQYQRVVGAVDTILAAPLNPGDTTITLADATGWDDGTTTHRRSIRWYGYQDSTGFTYPNYTYSRNVEIDAWDAGAISGNTITLRDPWTGPALAVGDAVSNSTSGGTYQYPLLSNGHIELAGDSYTGDIGGGFISGGVGGTTLWRPGTHSIRALALANRGTGPVSLHVSNWQLEAANESRLEPGQEVTFQITVEIDPDAPGAIYDGTTGSAPAGDLENQASVDAVDPFNGLPVADTSDDPTDPTDAEYGDDSDPDDPTAIRFPLVDLEKQVSAANPPAIQPDGTWNVEFVLTLANTGSTVLDNLTMFDNLTAPGSLGLMWQSTTAVSIDVSGVTTGDDPALNSGWQTDPTQNILDGSGSLNVGDELVVTFTVNIDPDVSGSSQSPVVNQATAGATGPSGTLVSDISDDPTDATDSDPNSDNNPDDPTLIEIADIGVAKQVNDVIDLGTGQYRVEYVVVVENTGTVDLTNIVVEEDLESQLTDAFDAVFSGPTVAASDLSSGSSLPTINTAGWDGLTAGDIELTSGGGLLAPGDSFTLVFTVDLDTTPPDGGDDDFQNSVTATADGANGQPATDDSDSGTNPNTDNGDGGVNDETPLQIPQIRSAKSHGVATQNSDGSYDMPVTITVFNTGTVPLTDLTLEDNIADEFGNAFISVSGMSIQAVGAFNGTLPTLNTAWTTLDTSVGIVDTTVANELLPNEAYEFTFTVKLDPDLIDLVSQPLDNQAEVSGEGTNFDGSPVTVDDQSGNESAIADGVDNDQPTPVIIPEVITRKSLIGTVTASSGDQGNIDATYEFTLTNSGTVPLEAPSITDDWTNEFGGAFIGVVDVDLSDDAIVPPLSGIGGNASYNGAASDNMFDGSGTILPGETITVRVTIEVDPDRDPAKLVNGQLVNQAEGAGTYDPTPGTPGDEVTVDDLSDDPTDPTDNETEGDGEPDDPTVLSVADIEVTKDVSTTSPPVPAASGIAGNFDVTYELIVTNTGTETLSNLSLVDDLETQMGDAFRGVVSVTVQNIDATSAPAGNNGVYDGTAGTDMLVGDAADVLESGQQYRVVLVVELDPDAIGAVYNADGELENSASAAGEGQHSGLVTDISDDTTDTTNTNDPGDPDNDPDDPTALLLADIELEKTATNIVPASSGIAGNHDVTYEFVFTNTGNDDLTNLELTDDWVGQFGGMFVTVVDVDLSDDVTVPAGSGIGGNNAYAGLATDNMLDGAGMLAPGESVTIIVTVEVDPDADPSFLVGGTLENSATVEATDSNNNPVSDISNDPTDGDTTDLDGDNEPDSPVNISLADIDLEKIISTATPPVPATSGTIGNFDVTYEFVVTNTGSEALSNLSLTDDLETQYGGAFVDVVSVAVINISATSAPDPNGSYDGTGGSDLLLGAPADDLQPGEQFRVVLVVEVDPDNPDAVTNSDGELENSAETSGLGENGGTPTDVSDDTNNSDDVQDPSDMDNDGDDPTTLLLGELELEKTVGTVVPSSNGVAGQYDVTYTYTIRNTSNDAISNVALVDDWVTHFGGAFVGVVDMDLSDNVSGSATVTGNNAYAGGAAENMLAAGSILGSQEVVTVTVVVTVQPTSPTANLTDGALVNSATVNGMDSDGDPVSDVSDDPTDPTNSDTNGNNDPDDPTIVSIADIDVEKIISTATPPVPATSGTRGNFDVTYELIVTNTGTEDLSNLTLLDDLESQMGGAFIDVVSVSVVNIDATTPPAPNANYDGTMGSDMLLGSATDNLEVGQKFTVVLVVELDPNNANGNYNAAGELENSAEVAGDGQYSGTVTDVSDDTTDSSDVQDPSDIDNDGDDPTDLLIGAVELEKSVSHPVPAASGVAGHFDLVYTFVVTNTGNDDLAQLTLTDDWATQFGTGFIGIADVDLSDNVSGSSTVAGSSNYQGGAMENMFAAGSTLAVGETVTIDVLVTVTPNAPGANLQDGKFVNSADVEGADSDGGPVTDISDDPTDPTDVDTNGNNNPDDPTAVGFGEVGDFVFFDADGDGTYDPATDVPYPGVPVTLTGDIDGDGVPETFTTTTDANGNYLFDGLPLIEWTVTVGNPPGTDNTFDADGGNDGESVVELIDTDFVNHDQDFGVTGTGSIGDTVFLDMDGDGVQDPNEIGIPGVPVSIDIDIDGDGTPDVTVMTVTNQNGKYVFENLPPGDHVVTVNPPLSLDETADLDGDGNPDTNSTVTLGPGEDNLDQDFGFVGVGTIGDTVFIDVNHNGEVDQDEGIGGVTVDLKVDLDGDGRNETITTVTAPNGTYLFDGLPLATDYIVKVDPTTLPVGLTQTVDPDGGNNNRSGLRLTNSNRNQLDQDFGYAGAGTIGDIIYADLNGNGSPDVGEGLAGVTVEIKVDWDGDGQLETFTTVTDANGNYAFHCLPTGLDYLTKVIPATLPPGMQNTVDPDGGDPNRSEFRLTHTRPENTSQDFGYVGPGQIGDAIFADINGNGVPDPGEGLAGVTVELKLDLNGDGTVDTVTTTTDSDGNYLFEGLPFKDSLNNDPLDYKVKVDKTTLPPGLRNVIDPDGGNNSRSETTLDANTHEDLDQDFGYVGPGEIGDSIFVDVDGDGEPDPDEGLAGVTVILKADIDGDGDLETFTTTTDANGNYLFEGLPVDDGSGNGIEYKVQVDKDTLPPGLENTVDPDGGRNGRSEVTLTPDDPTDFDQDFGYQGAGAAGDTIFQDINGNGLPDPGEGIAGVTVELVGDFDGDGSVEKVKTTTDADGNYLFEGLPVESPSGGGIDYSIKVDKEAGAVGETLPSDFRNTVDPHRTNNGISEFELTNNNPTDFDQDFGFADKGEIGDRVFVDEDGDGRWDSGEGLEGVEVTLTGDFDNDGILDTVTTTTDEDGKYLFMGLERDRDYVVTVNSDTIPEGYANVIDPDGGRDLTSEVTLDKRRKTGEDFGFVPPVDLGITKDNLDNADLATSGEEYTYEIVVTNHGPGLAYRARVVDRLPDEIISATWTATGTRGTSFTKSGTGDIVEEVTIPAGGSITYTLVANTRNDFEGEVINKARVKTDFDQVDFNPDNDLAKDETEVAELAVQPLHDPVAGEPLTLSSRGQTNDASLVNFYASRRLGSTPIPNSDLSLGLDDAILIGTGFLCDAGTIEVIWNVPEDAAGQTWYVQSVETNPVERLSNVQRMDIGSSGQGGGGALRDDSHGNIDHDHVDIQGHVLTVRGTDEADDIHVTVNNANVTVSVNGEKVLVDSEVDRFHRVDIRSGDGDDNVTVTNVGDSASSLHAGVFIQTGEGDDTVHSTDLDVTVQGQAGDDVITVLGQEDHIVEIDGASGHDVLTVVGNARGQLSGGEGDDTITGGSGNDAITGGDGDDVIEANGGNDRVEAGDGDDIVHGGRGKDIIVGGDGNDELRGGYSNDILLAGDGNDDVVGGRGNDLIVGVATHFDHDMDRLKTIRGIWNGEGSYEDRVAELRDETSGLLREQIVTQSNDDDSLSGGEGIDLFFAGLAPEQQVLDLDAMEELFDQN